MSAYSKALAGESTRIKGGLGTWDEKNEVLNGVTLDQLERYARVVAYKVAHNLSLGSEMDPEMDPLTYVDCGGGPDLHEQFGDAVVDKDDREATDVFDQLRFEEGRPVFITGGVVLPELTPEEADNFRGSFRVIQHAVIEFRGSRRVLHIDPVTAESDTGILNKVVGKIGRVLNRCVKAPKDWWETSVSQEVLDEVIHKNDEGRLGWQRAKGETHGR